MHSYSNAYINRARLAGLWTCSHSHLLCTRAWRRRVLFLVPSSRVNCVHNTLQPSRYPGTGWRSHCAGSATPPPVLLCPGCCYAEMFPGTQFTLESVLRPLRKLVLLVVNNNWPFPDKAAATIGASPPATHANLRTATRNWSFSVLGFWDKNAGICAGAMPYRRDVQATSRI